MIWKLSLDGLFHLKIANEPLAFTFHSAAHWHHCGILVLASRKNNWFGWKWLHLALDAKHTRTHIFTLCVSIRIQSQKTVAWVHPSFPWWWKRVSAHTRWSIKCPMKGVLRLWCWHLVRTCGFMLPDQRRKQQWQWWAARWGVIKVRASDQWMLREWLLINTVMRSLPQVKSISHFVTVEWQAKIHSKHSTRRPLCFESWGDEELELINKNCPNSWYVPSKW